MNTRRKLIATVILLCLVCVAFSQDDKEEKSVFAPKDVTLEWENLKLMSELKRNQAANLLAQADELDRQASEKISEIAKALKVDPATHEALFDSKTRQLYFKKREKKAKQ